MWCPQRPEEASDTLELDLHLMMWVLGTALRSYRRAVITPTSESFLLTLVSINFFKLTITKIKRTKITANFINIILSSTVL